MRSVSIAPLALALVAVLPHFSAAQQPLPPHGPAALSVPHPLPPPVSTLAVPPRDLYQQLTPPVMHPGIHYPGHVYGPFIPYSPYGPYPPYGPAMYGGSGYAVGVPAAPSPPITTVARGGLRFDSSPGSAQVYVDGLYVGSVDDFGVSGRALDLDEGAHRVELRAAGYATLNFDINITANQTTRYRGDLQRLPAPPAVVVAAQPAAPRTTYVIPNCYAGDRPPSRALPRGCDISKMLVRKP